MVILSSNSTYYRDSFYFSFCIFFFALNKLIYTVIHKFYACFSSVPVHEVCILG
jgi:hypothetical protein